MNVEISVNSPDERRTSMMTNFARFRSFFVGLFFLLLLYPSVSAADSGNPAQAKNVIVLIADGCGSEQYTLARWFKSAPLSLDAILVGAVKTYSADSVVTDSAPAATAYATGFRSNDGFISMGPNEHTLSVVPVPPEAMRYRPLATVLEGAKLKGLATGIVVTSRVSHATPAAYIAHVSFRNMERDIMEQAVHQNIDVVFGGGKGLITSDRSEGKDLLTVLKARGYALVETREDLKTLGPGKVFGLFANSHMAPEIDRRAAAPGQPTLEEMTAKAIGQLSRNKKGFFLMVEGSQIDWADHANDPAHLLGDLLQFDRAVAVALEFAKKDGHTLVIALSDHNTGGMSIGNVSTNAGYSQMKLEKLLEPLRKMKTSAIALSLKLGKDRTPEKVKAVVKDYWGMDITDEDAGAILAGFGGKSKTGEMADHFNFGRVLCPKYTYLGWTTSGHVGGDVPLYAYGPGSPKGLQDAPEIGKLCAAALGIDLDAVNRRLFVDAKKVFGKDAVHLEKSPAGTSVAIDYQGQKFELPVNRNIFKKSGQDTELEGIVVYSPETGKAYIPLQAVRLIKGE
jgi:alkaline phosphatase